jgi:hypothetical protein
LYNSINQTEKRDRIESLVARWPDFGSSRRPIAAPQRAPGRFFCGLLNKRSAMAISGKGSRLGSGDVEYYARILDLPVEERPREKLQHRGAPVLSNPELIAILLRTGIAGENALDIAARLLGWQPSRPQASDRRCPALNRPHASRMLAGGAANQTPVSDGACYG